MERARRQAAGPMRVILEASKSKRRVQEPEASDAADTTRRIAVRPTPAPAAVAAGAGAPAETAVIASRSFVPASLQPATPVLAPAAVPAPAASAAPVLPSAALQPVANGEGITTAITMASDNLQRRADNVATPALQAVGRADMALPLPKAAEVMTSLVDTKPKLVTMVEPVMTPGLLDGVRRETGVTAELTIRADGTVASVSVLPHASRQLVRAMVAALEQWRFEPLPSVRQHRVQLVFND
jgi:hypothetical protein